MKVVSESRVTWATSVPILVFLGHPVLDLGPIYATDRQTSDAHHRLMPLLYGWGLISERRIRACLRVGGTTVMWLIAGIVLFMLLLSTFIVIVVVLIKRRSDARRHRSGIELQIRDDLFHQPSEDDDEHQRTGRHLRRGHHRF